MTEISGENLSEVLFKPHRTSLETSFISNSVAELPPARDGSPRRWFRGIHRDYWGWMGLDLIEVQQALANISASDKPRTREGVLDTVFEYGPGNWIYEFSLLGDKYALLGKNAAEDPAARDEAYRCYRLSYLYYALASYPHLRGDELGAQALLLNHLNYRRAAEFQDCRLDIVKFPTEGGEGTAYIHTPDRNKCLPCVMIFGSYEYLATEYLRFFRECLYPAGIAMVTMDLPGMGMNAKVKFTPRLGMVHEAALDYIAKNVPWIDKTRIAAVGQRFGCACALHALAARPDGFRTACLVEPIVNDVFMDKDLLKLASPIQRAIMCNRIDEDAANWENLLPRLQVLSVKRQGILGGLKLDLPILVLGTPAKNISTPGDVALVKALSSESESRVLKAGSAFELFTKFIDEVTGWIGRQLL